MSCNRKYTAFVLVANLQVFIPCLSLRCISRFLIVDLSCGKNGDRDMDLNQKQIFLSHCLSKVHYTVMAGQFIIKWTWVYGNIINGVYILKSIVYKSFGWLTPRGIQAKEADIIFSRPIIEPP